VESIVTLSIGAIFGYMILASIDYLREHMGQKPRAKPNHLPAKLLAIRQRFGLSQCQMAVVVGLDTAFGRISEYETGAREPNLLVLLAYSQVAHIHLELLVNDRVDLTSFRDALAKETRSIFKSKAR
jgi:DNA-binding XRE family transcriptional regulator